MVYFVREPKKPDYEARCNTCRWFTYQTVKESGNRGAPGRCHKHAPSITGWPVVYETDWCGDYKLDELKL